MENDGEKRKIMSLRDGIEIKSYAELSELTGAALLFEPLKDRTFYFSTEFDCPGLIHIDTGTRFFSDDIQTYVTFPLHRIKLVPFTKDDLDTS